MSAIWPPLHNQGDTPLCTRYPHLRRRDKLQLPHTFRAALLHAFFEIMSSSLVTDIPGSDASSWGPLSANSGTGDGRSGTIHERTPVEGSNISAMKYSAAGIGDTSISLGSATRSELQPDQTSISNTPQSPTISKRSRFGFGKHNNGPSTDVDALLRVDLDPHVVFEMVGGHFSGVVERWRDGYVYLSN